MNHSSVLQMLGSSNGACHSRRTVRSITTSRQGRADLNLSQSTCARAAPHLSKKRPVACQAEVSNNQEHTGQHFNESEYTKLRLERVWTNEQAILGYLVFVPYETTQVWLGGNEQGMVVKVSGDTLHCFCKLLSGEPTAKPMPLDVLSGHLIHNSTRPPQEWGIVRVALTSLKNTDCTARVYFGDRRTGQIAWEQEMRATDAAYLAEQWKAPFYVHSAVWNHAAITHLQVQQQGYGSNLPSGAEASTNSSSKPESSASNPQPVLKQSKTTSAGADERKTDEPGVVKMLKRQLAVAIEEEDYEQAAQLRDSPLMELYHQVQNLKTMGDIPAAMVLEDKFNAAAASWEFNDVQKK